MVDKLALAWENAELFSSAADELAEQALTVLEAPTAKQTSAFGQPQVRFMTLAAVPTGFQAVSLAQATPKSSIHRRGRRNLTKQYDAIKGASGISSLPNSSAPTQKPPTSRWRCTRSHPRTGNGGRHLLE